VRIHYKINMFRTELCIDSERKTTSLTISSYTIDSNRLRLSAMYFIQESMRTIGF